MGERAREPGAGSSRAQGPVPSSSRPTRGPRPRPWEPPRTPWSPADPRGPPGTPSGALKRPQLGPRGTGRDGAGSQGVPRGSPRTGDPRGPPRTPEKKTSIADPQARKTLKRPLLNRRAGLALEPGTHATGSPPRTRWCPRGPPRTPRAGARPRKPGLGTSRDHQGAPEGVLGGPRPASEHRRPGTTSRDPRGPPGPVPGPENRAWGPPGTSRDHQGAPAGVLGGPRPASEHRRPGTTSGDPRGPPEPAPGPENRAWGPPGTSRDLQGPPGTTTGAPWRASEHRRPGTTSRDPPGATRRSVGPRVPTFKHPSAGAIGLRPAPQAPQGPGDILDLETFSQRPRDLGVFRDFEKIPARRAEDRPAAGPLCAPHSQALLSGRSRLRLRPRDAAAAPGPFFTLQKGLV